MLETKDTALDAQPAEPDTSPVYLRIALDIARRIARDDLHEGEKIYGRSILSSEYRVSPETIRRALKLLSDMQVVEVKHNSGAVVLSRSAASAYIERFDEYAGVQALRKKLKKTMEEHAVLSKKIVELASDISGMTSRVAEGSPFRNYEIDVPGGSPVCGQTEDELNFWQKTGATIIAVRRAGRLILSPGPYFRFEAEDVIVFIGDEPSIFGVQSLLSSPQ